MGSQPSGFCDDTSYNNFSVFFVLKRHSCQNQIPWLIKNRSKRTKGSSQDNAKIVSVLLVVILQKIIISDEEIANYVKGINLPKFLQTKANTIKVK